jgi:uncharacterized membrane protein
MKNVFLSFLLGFILFCILVKAESVSQAITSEIYNNDTAYYKLSIIFINHTSKSFTIPLGSASNIKLETSVNCIEQKRMIETNIFCNFEASSRTDIVIEYDAKTVSKKDSYFLFTDSFKIVEDTNSISILVKLPEGTGLKEPTEESYNPKYALIGSDGRRPLINWVKNDVKAGERFDVSVAFEKIGEQPTASFPFGIILVMVLIVFSSLGLFYQFYWRGKNLRLILPVLKKDEKKIFDTIIKHGNGINQKIIVKDSGYSKAKVSKVLSSLKERRLIKLERIGRSNKVYIEKNFEKKS